MYINVKNGDLTWEETVNSRGDFKIKDHIVIRTFLTSPTQNIHPYFSFTRVENSVTRDRQANILITAPAKSKLSLLKLV